MNNLIHRLCPACNHDNQHRESNQYSRNKWQIKDCSNCHFVYLENTPAYEALSSEFAWERTYAAEKIDRQRREPVKQFLSRCGKHFRQNVLKRDKLSKLINRHFLPGKVLEIGCAAGPNLRKLSQQHVPYGIEISEELAKQGNNNIQSQGGHILHADALSGARTFEENFFSGVIMSSYLEHEIEPLGILRECLRILKVDGKVIIKVPNYDCLNRKVRGPNWCGFRYPDHVNYFTPASLSKLCEEAGYSVHQFTYADRHHLSDSMWMVIQKPGHE